MTRHQFGEAVRDLLGGALLAGGFIGLLGGALLAGGFIGLLWAVDLAFIP